MNIIISPAKKMNIQNDDITYESLPEFLDSTKTILATIKQLNYEHLKELWQCNDKIAELNYDRYLHMDLEKGLSPAILSYEGIQYKYMAPNSFSENEYEYIKKHLKILSGFYGILSPFHGVIPYRLEMQAKLQVGHSKNLYDFWKDNIYKALTKDSNIILNLASKEYSKAVEKYLKAGDTYVTCIFGTLKDGKIKVKATEAKMARGLMVRYLAANNIETLDGVKNFKDLGFKYSEDMSTEYEYIFLR